MLIAIEGIDGAGTSTQARLLAAWMNDVGFRTHLTCEPSGGPIGQLLRTILVHRTRQVNPAALALLFAADRLDHVHAEILPKLDAGTHVVTDRYVYSSLAYQSMDLEMEWVARINARAPEPDLTIYLRVDPATAEERRHSRGSTRELFETKTSQERIASIYDTIFGSTPSTRTPGANGMDPDGSTAIHGSTPSDPCVDPGGSAGIQAAIQRCPRWSVLDGHLSVDALHHQTRALVRKLAAKICPQGPDLPI